MATQGVPMRFLLVSDVHLDTPFAWARPAVARARRQMIRDTFLRALGVADEEDVDAVLVAVTSTSTSASPPTPPRSCATRSAR